MPKAVAAPTAPVATFVLFAASDKGTSNFNNLFKNGILPIGKGPHLSITAFLSVFENISIASSTHSLIFGSFGGFCAKSLNAVETLSKISASSVADSIPFVFNNSQNLPLPPFLNISRTSWPLPLKPF